MIDWKRKLTSRKFWMSLAGFVAGAVALFGGSGELANKISGAILSGAAVISYIIGEGMTDSAAVSSESSDSKGDKL